MEVPTTRTPNGHHLPPIPDAGPRGHAPSRVHIPTIPTPANRARQTALHTDAHQAADGASSSSAASLPGSAAGPLPGGQHAAHTGQRGPTANQRPEQGVGRQTPQRPPRKQGVTTPVPDTGIGHPTNSARTPRGSPPQLQHSPTAGARRTHRDNWDHDAGGPRADAEMTETSGPQKSGGSPPTATPCSMPQQREPSTGNVPEGHLGTHLGFYGVQNPKTSYSQKYYFFCQIIP